MPAWIVEDVRLTDGIVVQVGVEVVLTALRDPRFRRGVVTAAYIGTYHAEGGSGREPFIDIEYGPFRETRRLERETGMPV